MVLVRRTGSFCWLSSCQKSQVCGKFWSHWFNEEGANLPTRDMSGKTHLRPVNLEQHAFKSKQTALYCQEIRDLKNISINLFTIFVKLVWAGVCVCHPNPGFYVFLCFIWKYGIHKCLHLHMFHGKWLVFCNRHSGQHVEDCSHIGLYKKVP
jgi:hypothetical protein